MKRRNLIKLLSGLLAGLFARKVEARPENETIEERYRYYRVRSLDLTMGRSLEGTREELAVVVEHFSNALNKGLETRRGNVRHMEIRFRHLYDDEQRGIVGYLDGIIVTGPKEIPPYECRK